jgi:hypothetical protein
VTYPDPAGSITRENGCDERDATAYKFNIGVNYELGNIQQSTRKRNPKMDLDV